MLRQDLVQIANWIEDDSLILDLDAARHPAGPSAGFAQVRRLRHRNRRCLGARMRTPAGQRDPGRPRVRAAHVRRRHVRHRRALADAAGDAQRRVDTARNGSGRTARNRELSELSPLAPHRFAAGRTYAGHAGYPYQWYEPRTTSTCARPRTSNCWPRAWACGSPIGPCSPLASRSHCCATCGRTSRSTASKSADPGRIAALAQTSTSATLPLAAPSAEYADTRRRRQQAR